MKFFQKFRTRIAKRRFERALDSCTQADFERALALQRWFQDVKLVAGDKVILKFDGYYHVDVDRAETINNPEIKEFNELNQL